MIGYDNETPLNRERREGRQGGRGREGGREGGWGGRARVNMFR